MWISSCICLNERSDHYKDSVKSDTSKIINFQEMVAIEALMSSLIFGVVPPPPISLSGKFLWEKATVHEMEANLNILSNGL